MINTKEEAKNNYLDIINYYKEKVTDLLNKKVEFSLSFEGNSAQGLSNVTEQDNKDKYKQEHRL